MKKAILGLLLVSSALFASGNFNNNETQKTNQLEIESDYCSGFEEGYCEGYKDVKGEFAICPITPICPIPAIGKDSYRGGYNKGFKMGMKKAKE